MQTLLARFVISSFILIALISGYGYFTFASSHYLKQLDQQSELSGRVLLHLSQLREKSQQYKLNAPRDYESYNRDVAVFYREFNAQIGDISNEVESLSMLQVRSDIMVNLLLGNEITEALIAQCQRSLIDWKEFVFDLKSQLGSETEPRLEWAAEYIINNIDTYADALSKLNQQTLDLKQQFEQTQQLGIISLMAIIFIYLIALIVFMISKVIRPVVHVAKSCEQVAAGEYGLQVDEDAVGEIKTLQRAFNQLSSRSELMMELVTTSHKGDTTKARVKNIFDSGYKALGVNWIGLMSIDQEEEQANLMTSAPALLDDGWRHRHVSLHKAFGRELTDSFDKQWLQIKDIAKMALQRHDERFLRELHHNTLATEIAGFPFKCPKQHNFILLFSTAAEGGFDKQQLKLLRSLTSQMADNIVGSL